MIVFASTTYEMLLASFITQSATCNCTIPVPLCSTRSAKNYKHVAINIQCLLRRRQLLDLVTWFRFIFGGFLIWFLGRAGQRQCMAAWEIVHLTRSGIQAAKDDEEEDAKKRLVTLIQTIILS